MQHHTVQQLERGPRAGKYVCTGGNRRMGRIVECCVDAMAEVLSLPAEQRDTSPVWARIGHDTQEQAYAHMREQLLGRLRLEAGFGDWHGCRAPLGGGMVCDVPTKRGAEIPPMHFSAPLCDLHRIRSVVEAMWDGPGDSYGSF